MKLTCEVLAMQRLATQAYLRTDFPELASVVEPLHRTLKLPGKLLRPMYAASGHSTGSGVMVLRTGTYAGYVVAYARQECLPSTLLSDRGLRVAQRVMRRYLRLLLSPFKHYIQFQVEVASELQILSRFFLVKFSYRRTKPHPDDELWRRRACWLVAQYLGHYDRFFIQEIVRELACTKS